MPIVKSEKHIKKARLVARGATIAVLGGVFSFFFVDKDLGMLTVLLGVASSSLWNLYDNS